MQQMHSWLYLASSGSDEIIFSQLHQAVLYLSLPIAW